jgi:pyruvate/2-oxoglutarate dehydrogenase complex dihydrolipoamide acyltransferase (E2) component
MFYARLPRWIRLAIFRWMMRDPQRRKRMMGTVSLSSVGMFGAGRGGYAIGYLPCHTMGVFVGGIARKPGVISGNNDNDNDDDHIEIRDYLCLSLQFDHDVVDGAPAARFTKQFVDLLESAAVLLDDDSSTESEFHRETHK